MAASSARWRVAIVLPPREGFSPQSAGAIALLQARLSRPEAAPDSAFDPTVIGAVQPWPVFPLPYRTVPHRLWPIGTDARYADGVRQVLRDLNPYLIEVHNRPDLATRLARWFPPRRIALFLHNDPRSMRGAKRTHERLALSTRSRPYRLRFELSRRLLDGRAGCCQATGRTTELYRHPVAADVGRARQGDPLRRSCRGRQGRGQFRPRLRRRAAHLAGVAGSHDRCRPVPVRQPGNTLYGKAEDRGDGGRDPLVGLLRSCGGHGRPGAGRHCRGAQSLGKSPSA